MKKHVIKTAKAELLIVELPEGSEPLSIIGNSFFYYEKDMVKEDYPKSLTLATSYTLLGKPDEIREEDAKELVKMGSYTSTFWNYKTNDNHKSNQLRTAKDSLLSLLESEIYWDVNPEGKFPRYAFDENVNPKDIKARVYYQKWHEAEQKTFDKSRSLIFKKNN